MHLVYPLVLSALLLGTGIYGVLARRNAILVLMSVELMLNAVTVSLIAFDVWLQEALVGQVWQQEEQRVGQSLAVFVITIAAAEIGLGLAIVLMVYRSRGTIAVDQLTTLRERSGRDA